MDFPPSIGMRGKKFPTIIIVSGSPSSCQHSFRQVEQLTRITRTKPSQLTYSIPISHLTTSNILVSEDPSQMQVSYLRDCAVDKSKFLLKGWRDRPGLDDKHKPTIGLPQEAVPTRLCALVALVNFSRVVSLSLGSKYLQHLVLAVYILRPWAPGPVLAPARVRLTSALWAMPRRGRSALYGRCHC